MLSAFMLKQGLLDRAVTSGAILDARPLMGVAATPRNR
jgi:hypothetical protein